MASSVPKRISGRDCEILYRHLLGMSNRDIAADLSVSEGMVSITINSDWARQEKAKIHAATLTKIAKGEYSPQVLIRAHTQEMLSIQLEIARNGKSETNKLRAAEGWLDRSLGRAVQEVKHSNKDDIFDRMSADELDRFAATGIAPEWAREELGENRGIPTGGGDGGSFGGDGGRGGAGSLAEPDSAASSSRTTSSGGTFPNSGGGPTIR